MSRAASLAVVLVAFAACSKSNTPDGGTRGARANDRVPVPRRGNDRAAMPLKLGNVGAPAHNPEQKLSPDEGAIVVDAAQTTAGSETTVKVAVTAAEKYKVNIEFPSKLKLAEASGVKLAKAEFKAGGHDKSKGDAEV